MKKSKIFALACLMACFAGCKKFQSQTEQLNKDLVSYTEKSEQGDTLIGVKNVQNGQIVLKPGKWQSVSVENALLLADGKNGTRYYYTFTGKPLGALSNLITVTDSVDTFYKGTGESGLSFYFPSQDEIVSVEKSYIGRIYVFLQTPKGWEIRNYAGSLLWKIPEKRFWFVKQMNATVESFVIAVVRNNQVILSSVNGQELKKVPLKRWERAVKKFRRYVPIGTAIYGETEIEKI